MCFFVTLCILLVDECKKKKQQKLKTTALSNDTQKHFYLTKICRVETVVLEGKNRKICRLDNIFAPIYRKCTFFD